MNKHGIPGPRKRKKTCVDYYDVEDIAPSAARIHQVHVHEWNGGTGADVSAYQYAMAQHSSQLPESQWYSSLFPSAEPTLLEAKSWSANNVISQYDPVLDKQLPVGPTSNARIRVSLPGQSNLDDCLITNQFDPLDRWRKEIPVFLDEILRLDGRGDFIDQDLCPRCELGQATFRCRDCFSDELACQTCTVSFHSHNPFHRIEVSRHLRLRSLV